VASNRFTGIPQISGGAKTKVPFQFILHGVLLLADVRTEKLIGGR